MRIHTDHNGVYVNAISRTSEGKDVEGHLYQIVAGVHVSSLEFQNGPIKEAGVNGITNKALLAILAHRIAYLNGKFPCRENSIALTKIQEAAHWLEHRTKDRLTSGVEGEHKA